MTPVQQYPTIAPAKLKANPWNTNRCSPDAEAKIDEAVKRFGMFKPVIVRQMADGTLQIIGGQHRVESALRLKLKEIPFFNLGFISDTKAKEIGLVDNGRYGEDDTLGLAQLLEELGGPDELTFLPYSQQDYESIFASTNIALDELEMPEDDGDLPGEPAAPAVQTHSLMRFKVPTGDVSTITTLIEKVMKQQHFTDEDSLANAGNALVHIFKDLL